MKDDDEFASVVINDRPVRILEDKYKLSILLDLLEVERHPENNEGRNYLITSDIRNKYSNNSRISEKLKDLERAGLIVQVRMKEHNKICITLTEIGSYVAKSLETIELFMLADCYSPDHKSHFTLPNDIPSEDRERMVKGIAKNQRKYLVKFLEARNIGDHPLSIEAYEYASNVAFNHSNPNGNLSDEETPKKKINEVSVRILDYDSVSKLKKKTNKK